jgi:hypothetical protein
MPRPDQPTGTDLSEQEGGLTWWEDVHVPNLADFERDADAHAEQVWHDRYDGISDAH